MKTNPLPATRTEKVHGKHSTHFGQYIMECPDHYHAISEIPLREKIQTGKRKLSEVFSFIASPDLPTATLSDLEEADRQAEDTFLKEYASSCTNIKNGLSASQQQDHVRSVLCGDVANELQNTFSASFIWLVCADLLEKEGLGDQSWAALVELASLEHRLELACLSEHERRVKARHKKNGSKANARFANLKEYLLEYLHKKAPESGWKTVKSAASQLAPEIWNRHESSDHRAIYQISESEIETLITNWMYKDKVIKPVFKENKRRRV